MSTEALVADVRKFANNVVGRKLIPSIPASTVADYKDAHQKLVELVRRGYDIGKLSFAGVLFAVEMPQYVFTGFKNIETPPIDDETNFDVVFPYQFSSYAADFDIMGTKTRMLHIDCKHCKEKDLLASGFHLLLEADDKAHTLYNDINKSLKNAVTGHHCKKSIPHFLCCASCGTVVILSAFYQCPMANCLHKSDHEKESCGVCRSIKDVKDLDGSVTHWSPNIHAMLAEKYIENGDLLKSATIGDDDQAGSASDEEPYGGDASGLNMLVDTALNTTTDTANAKVVKKKKTLASKVKFYCKGCKQLKEWSSSKCHNPDCPMVVGKNNNTTDSLKKAADSPLTSVKGAEDSAVEQQVDVGNQDETVCIPDSQEEDNNDQGNGEADREKHPEGTSDDEGEGERQGERQGERKRKRKGEDEGEDEGEGEEKGQDPDNFANKLISDIEDMDTNIICSEVNIDADAAELKSAQDQAKELEASARTLKREIESLQDQERNQKEAYRAKQLQMDELQKTLNDMQAQFKVIQENIKEIDDSLTLHGSEKRKLSDEAKELTNNIAQKQLEMQKANGQANNLNKMALYITKKMATDQERLKADKERRQNLQHLRDEHLKSTSKRTKK